MLASTVIESSDGIALSDFIASIDEPAPRLIVGKQVKSDFTYALILFTKSQGL